MADFSPLTWNASKQGAELLLKTKEAALKVQKARPSQATGALKPGQNPVVAAIMRWAHHGGKK